MGQGRLLNYTIYATKQAQDMHHNPSLFRNKNFAKCEFYQNLIFELLRF